MSRFPSVGWRSSVARAHHQSIGLRKIPKFQQERRSSAVPTGGKGSGKGAPRQKERDIARQPLRTPDEREPDDG